MDPFWGKVLAAGLFAYLIYRLFPKNSAVDLACKSCGFVGAGRSVVRGHFVIEILLWICLIVPGLIYSIWRAGSRHHVCPVCDGRDMIPADSPIGRRITAESSARFTQ